MLNEHTDVEVKQVLAEKSTDQTEAYVAQLQLQSPPSTLYHFQRQFAGKSQLSFLFWYELIITFRNSVTIWSGMQLLETKNARTPTF